MTNQFKAVLFDLDGTLLESNMETFLSPYLKLISARIAQLMPPQEFVAQLMRATERMIANDGQVTNEELFASIFYPAIGRPRAEMEPMVYHCQSVEWTNAPWTRLTLPGNPPPRDVNRANRALVADLLEAIEQDREPKAGARHALWTIEMAMALYESGRTGARVYFPLKRRDHPLTS